MGLEHVGQTKVISCGKLHNEKSSFAPQSTNMEMVFQKHFFPEAQADAAYIEEERKVKELKNQAAELDIVLITEQLKEIEVGIHQEQSLSNSIVEFM